MREVQAGSREKRLGSKNRENGSSPAITKQSFGYYPKYMQETQKESLCSGKSQNDIMLAGARITCKVAQAKAYASQRLSMRTWTTAGSTVKVFRVVKSKSLGS